MLTDYALFLLLQVGTTKGTGGDVLILEEAAYCPPDFVFEVVMPLLIIGNTSLLAISTLTSSINFYTRLIRIKDPVTQKPVFTVLQVELCCERCKQDGKAAECVHMLHLIPRWQSSTRHSMLRTVMEDRPDLIVSELSGLAFDATHQIFKPELLDTMFLQVPPLHVINEDIHIFIDPAAGGPFSDYCVLSVTRQKGLITVRLSQAIKYAIRRLLTRSSRDSSSFDTQWGNIVICISW